MAQGFADWQHFVHCHQVAKVRIGRTLLPIFNGAAAGISCPQRRSARDNGRRFPNRFLSTKAAGDGEPLQVQHANKGGQA